MLYSTFYASDRDNFHVGDVTSTSSTDMSSRAYRDYKNYRALNSSRNSVTMSNEDEIDGDYHSTMATNNNANSNPTSTDVNEAFENDPSITKSMSVSSLLSQHQHHSLSSGDDSENSETIDCDVEHMGLILKLFPSTVVPQYLYFGSERERIWKVPQSYSTSFSRSSIFRTKYYKLIIEKYGKSPLYSSYFTSPLHLKDSARISFYYFDEEEEEREKKERRERIKKLESCPGSSSVSSIVNTLQRSHHESIRNNKKKMNGSLLSIVQTVEGGSDVDLDVLTPLDSGEYDSNVVVDSKVSQKERKREREQLFSQLGLGERIQYHISRMFGTCGCGKGMKCTCHCDSPLESALAHDDQAQRDAAVFNLWPQTEHDIHQFASLLLGMLHIDRKSRFTVEECLRHPWMVEECETRKIEKIEAMKRERERREKEEAAQKAQKELVENRQKGKKKKRKRKKKKREEGSDGLLMEKKRKKRRKKKYISE
eukprot:gnl/Carplike_NY0171/685_a947_1307.p1 GENE.gnl/Carplike_NY0171/685_a947_1307~~gnl/Carplike_NY0171/685_a947_1307.p1  ORF type:complete len:482 (-),score=126.69 gnl/Carplike_NY0171/685_a947_1307:412-1857(-)